MALVEVTSEPALMVTAENAAPLLERAAAVEKMAKAAKDAVKTFVELNGPTPTADGRELRLVEVGPASIPAHTRKGYSFVKAVKL
jgi:hypothetical protein